MQCRHLLVLTTTLVVVWLSTRVTDAAIAQWPLNGAPCPYDETDVNHCGLGCWCEGDVAYCTTAPPACYDVSTSCHRCWPELNNFCCYKWYTSQVCGYVGMMSAGDSMTPCPLDMDAPGIVPAAESLSTGLANTIGHGPLNGAPCPYDETDVDSCGFGCWCENGHSYCSSPPTCTDSSCSRCWPELNNFCCRKVWFEGACAFVGVTDGSSPSDPCPLHMEAPGIVPVAPFHPLTSSLPTGK